MWTTGKNIYFLPDNFVMLFSCIVSYEIKYNFFSPFFVPFYFILLYVADILYANATVNTLELLLFGWVVVGMARCSAKLRARTHCCERRVHCVCVCVEEDLNSILFLSFLFSVRNYRAKVEKICQMAIN